MAKTMARGAAVVEDVPLRKGAADDAGGAGFLLERMRHHLQFTQARHWEGATQYNKYISLALAVRDVAASKMMQTHGKYAENKARRVYYLSLEYLLGRLLRNNLVNLGLYEDCRASLASIGESLSQILEVEPDAGLGNGGLGRLAACYIDSAATLGYPVYGYGIRYEHGIFEQRIENGWQVENPEYWLTYGTPWEFVRPEFATVIRLRGRVEHGADAAGRYRPKWVDFRTVVGVPYDIPIVGYANNTVNILRLWSSRASAAFDLKKFNRGGFMEAVQDKMMSETISKVLYPADETESGRHLRLVQQYFFVACTLADIIRRHEREHDTLDNLADKAAIQLNDTHPSLAIAELMRILVDERDMPWERAWEMTRAIFAYTNHTLMPEALEVWPVYMFERYLPRHLEIIYEINRRFLQTVEARWPGDGGRVRHMSLIQEDAPRSVRMAHLAIVGSHAVNGVAEMHSDLVRTSLVPDFAVLWPERFTNVTNGITPRRWLQACNPELAAAITRRIGSDWLHDFERIRDLAAHADDPVFQEEFRRVKRANKQRMGHLVQRNMGITLSNEALFDMQMKRLHEYKRQLLSILHVVMLYHELLDAPGSRVPRVVMYAAKAAPSYYRAKLVIKLIYDVASTINRDKRINEHLRVVFIPNYRVSVAEEMIPAADLSEQISTAGTEASGTGNMKFAMNGALTIGTLDGANVEIRKAVGEENFFLFGLTADEVAAARPQHNPWGIYHSNEPVRRALDALADGQFNTADPLLHRQVRDWLMREGDHYMLMADIASYADAQRRVEALWKDQAAWTRAAILNVANIGFFSSDRAVKEYAERIWNVEPTPISDVIS